ncbi:MAG: hypothetical protein R6X19_03285 [Kiritimatiellia bacterium]
MDTRAPTCEWTDRCVGIDETADGPVMVRALRRRGSWVLEPVGALLSDGSEAVASGLSEREAWVRRVHVSLGSRKKALQVLPSLLDVQLPFGIEECVVEFVGMDRAPGGGWSALTAAARRPDVRAALDRRAAGPGEPHVLDQEGLALWTQAAAECPPDSSAPRAVVYLDRDRATLALGRGADLAATQGLRRFDPEQALRQARLAFEGEAGSVLWIWTGPGAAEPEVLAGVRAGMNRQGAVRDRVMDDPRTVLARAYALRAMTPGPLRCDFRKRELDHPRVREWRRRRAAVSTGIWLAAGLALLALALVWKGLLVNREAAVRSALAGKARAIVARVEGGAAILPGYEVRSARQVMAEREALYMPFRRAKAPARSRELAQLLMAARDGSLVLYRLEWTESALHIEGEAGTEAAGKAFSRKVESITGKPVSFKTDRKGEHGVRFVMETVAE